VAISGASEYTDHVRRAAVFWGVICTLGGVLAVTALAYFWGLCVIGAAGLVWYGSASLFDLSLPIRRPGLRE
jgi:hypothetical protein